jgi:predicted metal-dependent hydrolase
MSGKKLISFTVHYPLHSAVNYVAAIHGELVVDRLGFHYSISQWGSCSYATRKISNLNSYGEFD